MSRSITKSVKACKDHQCCKCKGAINKGDTYMYTSTKINWYAWYTTKICMKCFELLLDEQITDTENVMKEKCQHGVELDRACIQCSEEIDKINSIVESSSLNSQEGGDHYKKLGEYQPWVVLSKWMTPEEMKGAMKKDVIGYLARESDKGGREDIKKAHHTLSMYLELTKEKS